MGLAGALAAHRAGASRASAGRRGFLVGTTARKLAPAVPSLADRRGRAGADAAVRFGALGHLASQLRLDCGAASDGPGSAQCGRKRSGLRGSDRQARRRSASRTGQGFHAADGQLSRKAAGARQRYRGFESAGGHESRQRPSAPPAACHVPGKAVHAGRGLGGKTTVTYPVRNAGQPADYGRQKARTLETGGRGTRRLAGLGRTALLVAAALPLLASPAFANSPAQNEVTREFQKTVTLTGAQGVSLDHRFGRVTIHGQGGHEVKLAATLRAQDTHSSDAQSFLQKIQVEVKEEGDGVHIRTIYPESRIPHIRIGGHSSFSVDYDIAMPAEAPLWMRNAFGNAEVSGVRGWSQLENSNGALLVRDAGGAKLVNAFGKIELTNASGNCSITNNNGAVNVSNVKGTLELRNRFGEIVAAQIGGAATISGGNARNRRGSADLRRHD